MEFRVDPNTQSPPRRAHGSYWVNGMATIRGLCLHARTQLQIRQPSSCMNPLCGPPSNWISSSNVKLRLLHDKLVVGPLLGDNASTRAVSAWLSAGTTITMETDVLAETPNMSMIAALGTQPRNACRLSRQSPSGCTRVRGSKHLRTNRRHGTSGRSCSKWTCWVAFSLAHFRPRRPRPSCRVRLRHAKTAPRPLNRLARGCRRFPGRLPRSQWTRPCLGPWLMTLFLLLLPKKPRQGRDSSTSREFFPHFKIHDTAPLLTKFEGIRSPLSQALSEHRFSDSADPQ